MASLSHEPGRKICYTPPEASITEQLPPWTYDKRDLIVANYALKAINWRTKGAEFAVITWMLSHMDPEGRVALKPALISKATWVQNERATQAAIGRLEALGFICRREPTSNVYGIDWDTLIHMPQADYEEKRQALRAARGKVRL